MTIFWHSYVILFKWILKSLTVQFQIEILIQLLCYSIDRSNKLFASLEAYCKREPNNIISAPSWNYEYISNNYFIYKLLIYSYVFF